MTLSLTQTGLCAAWAASIAFGQSTNWETIAPDFSNLRGANYIAAYDGLTAPANRPIGYRGVASSTAMWRFYDEATSHAEIDQQLDHAVGLGFNAIRVWISWPLWAHDHSAGTQPNRMVTRFQDLLTRCEARHLYVIPVLWDEVCASADPCTDPDYFDLLGETPPHQNIDHWIPNPGQPKLDEFEAGNWTSPEFTQYVTDIVTAGMASPSLLMWDAMNEPMDQTEHVLRTLALIKSIDPSATTTVGFTGIENSFPVAEAARSDDLDVISIHPYGTFRELIQLYVDYAEELRDDLGQPLQKPIIITEIGNPGLGQPYKDILSHLSNLNRVGTPDGIGFFVFSLMCGWQDGNFPFRDQQGIFFLDGEVRDVEACLSLQGFARADGIPELQLTQSFQQKSRLAPDFYPQGPLHDGHDYVDTLRNMALPQWYYGLISPAEGRQLASLFEVLQYDVGILAQGPGAVLAIDPFDLSLFNLLPTVYDTAAVGSMQLTQQELNALLDTWRLTLLPYIAQLEGATPQ